MQLFLGGLHRIFRATDIRGWDIQSMYEALLDLKQDG